MYKLDNLKKFKLSFVMILRITSMKFDGHLKPLLIRPNNHKISRFYRTVEIILNVQNPEPNYDYNNFFIKIKLSHCCSFLCSRLEARFHKHC